MDPFFKKTSLHMYINYCMFSIKLTMFNIEYVKCFVEISVNT